MTFAIPGASVSANSNAPSSMPALVLPRTAVSGDSAAPIAFAIDKGSVRRVELRIRPIDFDRVEVLSGLTEGQQVVLNPASTLRDGMKVRIRKTASAKADSGNVAR